MARPGAYRVRMARLAYLGTPELAVPPLEALLAAGHEVALVVSRPDRRRGRGGAVAPSPVKAAALARGLAVTDEVGAVAGAGAELAVVVAYGRLIPADLLAAVPMVNLHFSLLPRWRGAAPVERAILAGDEVTGVCVMAVEEALDTGALYACEEVAVAPGEHLGPLRDRLVARGSALLVALLADGVAGLPAPRPQEGEPTYAEKLTPGELALDWSRPAEALARVVRLDRAWTTFRGHRLRVLEAVAEPGPAAGPPPTPGTVEGARVATGDGWLVLRTVQPEGRAPMAAGDWARGARPAPGEALG